MRAAPLSVSGRAVAAAGRLGQFIALGQVLLPAGCDVAGVRAGGLLHGGR